LIGDMVFKNTTFPDDINVLPIPPRTKLET